MNWPVFVVAMLAWSGVVGLLVAMGIWMREADDDDGE